jgi:hypothetical protein
MDVLFSVLFADLVSLMYCEMLMMVPPNGVVEYKESKVVN